MAKSNKCSTKFCRGKKHGGRKMCSKCYMRAWREKNPILAAFHRKRWNAKRRGISFTLTFSQFRAIWIPGLVLDRELATRGYTLENVQNLTAHDNAVKGFEDKEMHAVNVYPLNDAPF